MKYPENMHNVSLRSFVECTSTTYCQSIIQVLRIIWVRCIPLILRSKTLLRATSTSTFYLDLLLSIGKDGQIRTSLYDKRDDFNFHITNFPFLNSNIPSPPAYGVFISQLIRYARYCSSLNVLFWGRRDLNMGFSSRNIPGNVWNRL